MHFVAHNVTKVNLDSSATVTKAASCVLAFRINNNYNIIIMFSYISIYCIITDRNKNCMTERAWG